MRRSCIAGQLVVAAVFCCTGCGANLGVATGNASYEGTPIERGAITFTPADGKGPVVGGEIRGGKYSVTEIPLGPKVVHIDAFKDVNFASSSQEMMDRAAEARTRGDSSGLVDPADIIPPQAQGNDQNVEIKPGANQLDFHLSKPK
jgi:hypothetical protein